MGEIRITRLGGLGFHANTLNEYDNEVQEELLENHLARIKSIYEGTDNYACYVLGMGGQPKTTYKELRKQTGVELVWVQSILTGFMRMLSPLVASYSGLVKIIEPERLLPVMLKLCHLSMAGVYIFDKSGEQNFVSRVMENPMPTEFDFGVKEDPRYFFYIVDADSSESSTGIFEIVSYGKSSDFAQLWKP